MPHPEGGAGIAVFCVQAAPAGRPCATEADDQGDEPGVGAERCLPTAGRNQSPLAQEVHL